MSPTHLAHLFLEQSEDLTWMVNREYELIFANSKYVSMVKLVTGKEPQLHASAFVSEFGEVYIEKWRSYYGRALHGENFEVEDHYYDPDSKEIRYGLTKLEPLRGEDQEIFAIACQSRDITRIVKQKSEETRMIDSSLDILCTVNEEGNFVYVSAASFQHWGYLPEELIGKPYLGFIVEEDVAQTKDIAAAIMNGAEVKSFVNRYTKKDGSISYNIWSARWDDTTKIMHCVARDGKEKIEQEEIILQSEERFKALVQEGSDLISILDLEGNYSYVSPTSTSILGLEPHEFMGKTPFEFIHPDDLERTLACLQQIATETKVTVEPFRFQNKKKEWRWIETVLTNMLDNPAIKGIVANSRDITESLQDLKQVEANELFNRSVLESSPDCLKVLDKEGGLQFMNFNGLCQMEIDDFGSFKGKSWWTLWGSENEALVKASLDKALKGETAQFTAFCPTANGTPKWWDVLVSPVGKPGEPVEQIISVSRDITERRKAEERIKDSEEKRRLIMSGALDAIICIDTQERITFWNLQAEIIFGWKEAEVMEQYLSELIVPQPFRKYHNDGIKHYLETGEGKALNILLELTAIRRSGEEFPIELTVIPVKQGGEVFFCAFIRDITERKKAAESILQSKERFEKVTEATNDAIWDWDLVNNTYYRSKAIERFFGKEASKTLDETEFWKDKFHHEDVARIQDSIAEAIANPLTSRWESEYRVFNEYGKMLYVIDRGVIIRNNEGKAIRMVGAMTDVSEQKQMTLQLSELNQSLQQHALELERSNEELEQFAFVASHDLQEPLRMISSFMDQLKRKYGDRLDEKGHQYIHFATDGAKRMKQIILDLLEYSRTSRPTEGKETVDLNEVLSDFNLLRRKLISEKNAVIISKDLPTLHTYKAAITQILHCLLDNALKYSVEGTPPSVAIEVAENETQWEFSVKDNGIGIDPQFYDKIFIIFQRLHNHSEYEGTGIGLSVAKRHVEFLGGRIWLNSAKGEGTTFYFVIPKT